MNRALSRRYGRAMTPTVAKAVKRFRGHDKAAHEAVGAYASRYMANRGLVASFPRLVVGMMAELPAVRVVLRDRQGRGRLLQSVTRVILPRRSLDDLIDSAKTPETPCFQAFSCDPKSA